MLLKNGAAYIFTNCDTGRTLGSDGAHIFTYISSDTGSPIYLYSEAAKGYLSVSADTTLISGEKSAFMICEPSDGKYILTSSGRALRDGDGGDTCFTLPSLSGQDVSDISCAWFASEISGTLPIKIMPLGDSITFGDSPDLRPDDLRSAYRCRLSELISDSSDVRFVFTGTQKQAPSSCVCKTLHRHEGHCAFTIYDIYDRPPFAGLYQNCDAWLAKYAPDMIFLLIGTNDVSLAYSVENKALRLPMLFGNYELLIQKLEKALPHGGLIVIGTPLPQLENPQFNEWSRELGEGIRRIAAEHNGKKVEIAVADTFGTILHTGKSAYSSDRGHPSPAGYSLIADIFFETFRNTDFFTQHFKKSLT